MTKEEALLLVQEQFEQHKGEWLTMDAAYSYAKKLNNDSSTDVRQVRLEIQHRFGVTELEAINISNGKNISDYVHKYQRIKQQIPLTPCDYISQTDEDEFYDDGFSFEESDLSEDN